MYRPKYRQKVETAGGVGTLLAVEERGDGTLAYAVRFSDGLVHCFDEVRPSGQEGHEVGTVVHFRGHPYAVTTEPYELCGAWWQDAVDAARGCRVTVKTPGQKMVDEDRQRVEFEEQQAAFRSLRERQRGRLAGPQYKPKGTLEGEVEIRETPLERLHRVLSQRVLGDEEQPDEPPVQGLYCSPFNVSGRPVVLRLLGPAKFSLRWTGNPNAASVTLVARGALAEVNWSGGIDSASEAQAYAGLLETAAKIADRLDGTAGTPKLDLDADADHHGRIFFTANTEGWPEGWHPITEVELDRLYEGAP